MKKSVKIVALILSIVLFAAAFELYCPPVVSIKSIAIADNSMIKDLFFRDGFSAEKAMNKFDTKDYWCLKYLNSDILEDYRFIAVTAKVTNLSFFRYEADSFVISSAKEHSDRFVFALNLNLDDVKALSSTNIVATVMMNVKGLSNDEIETAVRGLTLKTKSGSRDLFGLMNIPSNKLVYKLSSADDIAVKW